MITAQLKERLLAPICPCGLLISGSDFIKNSCETVLLWHHYDGVSYRETGLSTKPDSVWSRVKEGGEEARVLAWLTSSWISGHVISIAVCYLLCPAVSLLCLQRTHSSPEAQLTINQVGLGLLCTFVLFLLENFGLPGSCFKDSFSSRREICMRKVSTYQTLPCLPKRLCANTSDKVFTCYFI